MIVLLTQDLMLASSADQLAGRCKVPFKLVESVDEAFNLVKAEKVNLLLIDLQTAGFCLADFSRNVQALAAEVKPRSVAYAQHVNQDLLQQARDAKLDLVLTRGQFARQLPDLVQHCIGRAPTSRSSEKDD